VVAVDPAYFRPTEVELLIGDSSRARAELGWVPTYDLAGLVSDMVQSDLTLFRRDTVLLEAGHAVLSYHDE
jgi:GDPmannose 4,6-dehydratase